MGAGRGHVTGVAFFPCCSGGSEKADGNFSVSTVEKRELEHLWGFPLPCSRPDTDGGEGSW